MKKVKEELCESNLSSTKNDKITFDVAKVSKEVQENHTKLTFELKAVTNTNKKKIAKKVEKDLTPPSYFWEEEEHVKFAALFNQYGRKWKLISEYMMGRNTM